MPRLPTEDEVEAAQAEAAAHLDEVWAALHSSERSEAVFGDGERIIQAPLSPWGRVPIAEALLRYRRRVEEAQKAEALLKGAIKQAKQLVGRVRREIADLKNARDRYQQQLARAQAWPHARLRKLSAETGRECAALYLSIKDAVEELESLAGWRRRGAIYGVSSPYERLAQPANEVQEAVWKVQPLFCYADCESALSDLDDLLNAWAEKTGSRQGQSWESKALNDLIRDLGKVFEKATGPCASDTSDRLNLLLNRFLDALPAEFSKYYKRGEGTLAKRSRRVRSKNVLAAAN